MASWPTQSDYKDSLQNPDTAFRDPDLKQSQAERSPMGVPRARSGAFASVYKMTGPKGTVALKLFNFPNEDRAQRYKAVSDYLEKELGPKKPPCVVKFQYHLEGMRVGKGWYPTLTMAWVKGVSLGEWVRQTIEKKNPDVAAMRKMADAWVALVQQLQDTNIAHGDLQHDNVMVVGDAPVLVDYDGMCVPALDPTDPKKKLEQLEFGKPAYQHPARCVEKLSGNLDHFSAWVILIALRAIAADPQLYVKHVLKTDNENLLFSAQDMQTPATSTVWPDLIRCKDPEVGGWAKMLRESLDKPFAKIPPFSMATPEQLKATGARGYVYILSNASMPGCLKIGLTTKTPAERAKQLSGTGVPTPFQVEYCVAVTDCGTGERLIHQRLAHRRVNEDREFFNLPLEEAKLELDQMADEVGRVEADESAGLKAMCEAVEKRWALIVQEGERLLLIRKSLPADLKLIYEDARKRVAARDALQKAADARDPRAIVAAYTPALVDDWADPSLVRGARAAAGQVALLDKLKAAAAAPGDGKAFVKLWDEAAAKLVGVGEAKAYEKVADGWRARVRVADGFLRAYEKTPQTERELAEAWKAVMAAGPLHPSLTDAHRKRAEDALRWAPLLDTLRRVPNGASYKNDTELVTAWGTGGALTGCREATEFATRVSEANARLALVRTLEQAIKVADAGGPEHAVIEAASKIPVSYTHPHAARVGEGAEAIKLLAEVQKALAQKYPSDRKVAAAYDRLKAKSPKLANRLDKVDPALVAEAERCVARRKLFDAFAKIDAEEPRADRQDEKWQALWVKHGKVLQERRDREELRDRLVLARDRLTKWAKLAESLKARDIFALRKRHTAYADQLTGYPPMVERATEIQSLLAKADKVIAVQQKLVAGSVLAADDLKFLRENHEAFGADVKGEIEKQVRARLSGDAKLVPAYPAYSVTGTRGGLVKACWAWGGHGLITYCVVVVDGRRFLDRPEDADPYSRLTCKAENHQREGGGITVVPPAGASQAYVTIWPVVELGWTVVHGPPLSVGPVPVGGRW